MDFIHSQNVIAWNQTQSEVSKQSTESTQQYWAVSLTNPTSWLQSLRFSWLGQKEGVESVGLISDESSEITNSMPTKVKEFQHSDRRPNSLCQRLRKHSEESSPISSTAYQPQHKLWIAKANYQRYVRPICAEVIPYLEVWIGSKGLAREISIDEITRNQYYATMKTQARFWLRFNRN